MLKLFNFSFLSFIIIINANAQKNINITARHNNLKTKNVLIFENMNIDYYDSFTTNIYLEKQKNNISIHNWKSDTLTIKVKGMIPYVFTNLNNLDTNFINISDLILTKYIPIDTLISYSVKYKKDSTLNHNSEKTKIKYLNNSLKFINPKFSLNINGKEYDILVYKQRINNISWYCTPNKSANSYNTKGIQIFYLIKL